MKNSKNGFVPFVLLIIIAIVAIGVGVYYYANRSEEMPVETSTENWKTYRNTTYGFEFKYPSEFNFPTELSVKETEKDNYLLSKISIQGVGAISLHVITDRNSIQQYIEEIDENQLQQNRGEPIQRIRKTSNKELDGKKIIIQEVEKIEKYLPSIRTFIELSPNTFIFLNVSSSELLTGSPLKSKAEIEEDFKQMQQFNNQILSTFKFTN